METWCLFPFFPAEQGIPGTHGQTILFPYNPASHDIGVYEKTSAHSPYQRELLPVFLPEIGLLGTDDVQKFQHHRQNTVKMTLPISPFKDKAFLCFYYLKPVIIRIYFPLPGVEHKMGTRVFQ